MKRHSHLRQHCALKLFLGSHDQAVALTLFQEGELTVYLRYPKPEMGVMRYPSLPALLDEMAGQRPWLIEAIPCPARLQAEVAHPTLVGLALKSGQPLAIFIPAILDPQTVVGIFNAFPDLQILGGRNGIHLKEEVDYIVRVDAPELVSTPVSGSGTEGGRS